MRRRHAQRGFAVTMGLAAMVIIGLTISTLTMLFAMQASRTRVVTRTAQQEQLLLAGCVKAREALLRGMTGGMPAGAWHAALPAELKECDLTILPEGAHTFLITATVPGGVAGQRIVFEPVGNGWRVKQAERVAGR